MSLSQPEDVVASALEAETVMLVGAMDTGKTTMGRRIAREALLRGRTVAFVDADVANGTIGPPACVGLAVYRDVADVDSSPEPERVHFVGSTTIDRLVLQQVVATATMAAEGRRLADMVVVDTSNHVSGVIGETLKYHKVELIEPDLVVGLERGAELDPIIGMLRRFFSVEALTTGVDPDVNPASPEERSVRRNEAFLEAFAEPTGRWRVRPTVFAPTLPSGLDLTRLDGVLVGVLDGNGRCLGLGRLECDEDSLKVLTRVGEGMQGLRLGSTRIDLDTGRLTAVNLRELIFGI